MRRSSRITPPASRSTSSSGAPLNAIAPTRSRPQLSFKLDYSGGYGKYKQDYWKTFKSTCKAYDGPALAWKVTACKASDGSYWALQKWQRMLPNYGLAREPGAGRLGASPLALDR